MILQPHLRQTLPTLFAAFLGMACCGKSHGQKPIGTLSTNDAQISGTVNVQRNSAEIQSSGTVTAGGRTAEISLTRGGKVLICTTSTVHLTQSNNENAPLLLALNRGAFEIHMSANAQDAILTPDLRFDLSEAAPLDLRMRVTPNGDTCVENRGKSAPVLHVTEQFGGGGYFIKPGQRVLFEHGSVREVVDRESSNCGCPTGLVASSNDPKAFPEAVSQGLTPPHVPQAPPGEMHAQVSATIAYNGNEPVPTDTAAAPTLSATSAQASAPAPQQTTLQPAERPKAPNPFRAIGHFFRRIFGGGGS
ncbi:hypothetical protein [Terriglobus saanensis]|uniref:FecR protein domain-containing protein n=1 Tax=Terriglobus saanensis (strain ATCC BAA-1853 / DSM 23119 / SP1PR4) TaxID=401053 RepID=E8UZ56_TERSS|nr:hypothetical protein [Terriglobus saanensis]ADV82074.1 hypothetical protein AciPR4_1249 [Terriglobus saanensis SP1PR4]